MFAGWIGDPDTAVFIAGALGTDAPVGYAVLTEPDFPIAAEAGDIELRRIYTLAAMHGSGLGEALLDAALTEARRRGCRRVLLGVHPGNVRARRFYEKHGFAVIGERQFTVGAQLLIDPVYARII